MNMEIMNMKKRKLRELLKDVGCEFHKVKNGNGHSQESWITPGRSVIHIPGGTNINSGVLRQFQQILNKEGIRVKLKGSVGHS